MSEDFVSKLISAKEHMKIDSNALNQEINDADTKIKELKFYRNQLSKIRSILSDVSTNAITNDQKKILFDIIDILPQLKSLREVEVVFHVIQMKSNKEIASDMNITDKTVRFHKTNIFKRCGFKDSKDLVRHCLKIGDLSKAKELPMGLPNGN